MVDCKIFEGGKNSLPVHFNNYRDTPQCANRSHQNSREKAVNSAVVQRYFLTHINDQNKRQSPRKEDEEPTKGSLTAISTTDVFTEGCLLSTEQSHT